MKIVQEFKEFAVKGNAVDLAVGVIIGAAFGRIVTSLVEDIIMPPLGFIVGKIDFSNLFIALDGKIYPTLQSAERAGVPVIAYGQFINSIINFLIVAFAIFLLVKQINKMRKGEDSEPTGKECPFCTQSVAIAATRCPYCTSQLTAESASEVETPEELGNA